MRGAAQLHRNAFSHAHTYERTHMQREQRRHSAVRLLFLSPCRPELKVDLGVCRQAGGLREALKVGGGGRMEEWVMRRGRRGRRGGRAAEWAVETSCERYVWSMSKRSNLNPSATFFRNYITLSPPLAVIYHFTSHLESCQRKSTAADWLTELLHTRKKKKTRGMKHEWILRMDVIVLVVSAGNRSAKKPHESRFW